MIRSQFELEHGDASRAISRQYLSWTTAYEGFPGLASLAKRLSLHLGLNHGPHVLPKTESATPLQGLSSDIRLHGSGKIPHIYPSWLTWTIEMWYVRTTLSVELRRIGPATNATLMDYCFPEKRGRFPLGAQHSRFLARGVKLGWYSPPKMWP